MSETSEVAERVLDVGLVGHLDVDVPARAGVLVARRDPHGDPRRQHAGAADDGGQRVVGDGAEVVRRRRRACRSSPLSPAWFGLLMTR